LINGVINAPLLAAAAAFMRVWLSTTSRPRKKMMDLSFLPLTNPFFFVVQ
jgi:hypothetical protein